MVPEHGVVFLEDRENHIAQIATETIDLLPQLILDHCLRFILDVRN
jgi:hypothetical protein